LINIAIDASRAKSGGAISYILGILDEINPSDFSFDFTIHVWSYKLLLDRIPNKKYIAKYSNKLIEKNILSQLYWQYFIFPKELKLNNCHIVLYTDASSLVNFSPSVTMSRDMLSFEDGIMNKFFLSKSWIRLLIIKYVQIVSLKKSTGKIFLTNYAYNKIKKFTGPLNSCKIIPHGISKIFKNINYDFKINDLKSKKIKVIYVSNSSYYKNQIHVIKAVKKLRKKNRLNIILSLIGAKEGISSDNVLGYINKVDPNSKFIFTSSLLSHKKILNHFLKNNIFLFASSCENMPNTLLEGMASGLPILSSNKGPMPEVLGNSGLYFDPENVNSIEDALKKIIFDDTLRNDLLIKSKKSSSIYSWKRCSSETINFLYQVLINYNSKTIEK